MKRLIQLLPSHHRHDAIGAEALAIEGVLTRAGWQVETYAEFMDPELQGRTKPIAELEDPGDENTVALYHFAVCSDVTFRFSELSCPKAIIYHNVTPPEFFRPWDVGIAGVSEEALRQAQFLAKHVELGIGDSEFNRRDLERMGYRNTRKVPFLFDSSRYSIQPDAAMAERLKDRPTVLFVGRVAPNKAPDDFIRVAKAYFSIDGAPPARFVLAGKLDALPAYAQEIRNLIAGSGLGEDQLFVTDEISQPEMIAAYRSAALFLSLSRHEGFCVPILESWLFGVPVLALAEGAVPETLGEGGMLIETAEPKKVAETVCNLLCNEKMRSALAKEGKASLARYDLNKWGFVLHRMLEELCK